MTTIPPSVELAPTRTPRWMWISLVLSVALNLLIVGVVAAAMLHFRGRHGGHEARFVSYVGSLPAERRNVLLAVLEDQQKAIGPLRQQARTARRLVRDALEAEPFVREKLISAFQQASAARAAVDQSRGEWLTTIAEKMTAAERRGFLEWRRRHGPRRGHRRDRDDDGGSER